MSRPTECRSYCQLAVPGTVKDLRSWPGLATYLHKFAKDFAAIAQSLSQLLGKDVPGIGHKIAMMRLMASNRA